MLNSAACAVFVTRLTAAAVSLFEKHHDTLFDVHPHRGHRRHVCSVREDVRFVRHAASVAGRSACATLTFRSMAMSCSPCGATARLLSPARLMRCCARFARRLSLQSCA
eukprot:6205537-Pleurochrysis_carterae.AAC.2